MSSTKSKCEICGEPAIVHIATDDGTASLIRHFCIACAEQENIRADRHERFIDHGTVFVVVGLYILLLSALADLFSFGASEGFGYKQIAGVLIAITLFGVGGALRIPTLAFIGFFTGSITVLADWVGFGQHPGFGYQQILGSVLGLGLMVAGLTVARKQS